MKPKDLLFTVALFGAIGAVALAGKGLHMAFFSDVIRGIQVRVDPYELQMAALRGVALICAGAVCALVTISALVAATFVKEKARETTIEVTTSAAASRAKQ